MGRPSKISKEVVDRIINAVKAGNYIETAAAYAGISKPTLYAWMKKGNEQSKGIYRDFLNAIEKALAESEVRDVMIIGSAAKDNWQAAAWRLERKFPKRWGRHDRLDLNHEGKVNILHDVEAVEHTVRANRDVRNALEEAVLRSIFAEGEEPSGVSE